MGRFRVPGNPPIAAVLDRLQTGQTKAVGGSSRFVKSDGSGLRGEKGLKRGSLADTGKIGLPGHLVGGEVSGLLGALQALERLVSPASKGQGARQTIMKRPRGGRRE